MFGKKFLAFAAAGIVAVAVPAVSFARPHHHALSKAPTPKPAGTSLVSKKSVPATKLVSTKHASVKTLSVKKASASKLHTFKHKVSKLHHRKHHVSTLSTHKKSTVLTPAPTM